MVIIVVMLIKIVVNNSSSSIWPIHAGTDAESDADWSNDVTRSRVYFLLSRGENGGVRPHHQNCPFFGPTSRLSFAGIPFCQRGKCVCCVRLHIQSRFSVEVCK